MIDYREKPKRPRDDSQAWNQKLDALVSSSALESWNRKIDSMVPPMPIPDPGQFGGAGMPESARLGTGLMEPLPADQAAWFAAQAPQVVRGISGPTPASAALAQWSETEQFKDRIRMGGEPNYALSPQDEVISKTDPDWRMREAGLRPFPKPNLTEAMPQFMGLPGALGRTLGVRGAQPGEPGPPVTTGERMFVKGIAGPPAQYITGPIAQATIALERKLGAQPGTIFTGLAEAPGEVERYAQEHPAESRAEALGTGAARVLTTAAAIPYGPAAGAMGVAGRMLPRTLPTAARFGLTLPVFEAVQTLPRAAMEGESVGGAAAQTLLAAPRMLGSLFPPPNLVEQLTSDDPATVERALGYFENLAVLGALSAHGKSEARARSERYLQRVKTDFEKQTETLRNFSLEGELDIASPEHAQIASTWYAAAQALAARGVRVPLNPPVRIVLNGEVLYDPELKITEPQPPEAAKASERQTTEAAVAAEDSKPERAALLTVPEPKPTEPTTELRGVPLASAELTAGVPTEAAVTPQLKEPIHAEAVRSTQEEVWQEPSRRDLRRGWQEQGGAQPAGEVAAPQVVPAPVAAAPSKRPAVPGTFRTFVESRGLPWPVNKTSPEGAALFAEYQKTQETVIGRRLDEFERRAGRKPDTGEMFRMTAGSSVDDLLGVPRPAPPEAPAAKQPHEMTQAEFDRVIPVRMLNNTEWTALLPNGRRLRGDAKAEEAPSVTARSRVMAIAAQEGKTAPPAAPAAETPRPAELPAAKAPLEPGLAERVTIRADAARARIAARRSTLKAGINPEELADYALIAAEYVVKGAKTIADFTERMLKEAGEKAEDLRPYLKDLFAGAQKEANPQDLGPKDEAVLGLSFESINRRRALAGLPEIEPSQRRHVQEDYTRAQEAGLDRIPVALDIALAVVRDPLGRGTTTNEEYAGMDIAASKLEAQRAESARLLLELEIKGDEGARIREKRRLDHLTYNIKIITDAAHIAGSRAGSRLQIQQMGVTSAGDVQRVLSDAAKIKRSSLTPEEVRDLVQVSDAYRAQEKVIEALRAENDKLIDAQINREAERVFSLERRRAQITERTAERMGGIRERRADILKQLAAEGYRLNAYMGLNPKHAYLVGELAVTYIEEGALSIADAVQKVLAHLPELSERDVRSSLGARSPKAQKRARGRAQQQKADLLTQGKLLDGLSEVAEKAIGPDKMPPPEAIRFVQKELTRLRRLTYRTVGDSARLEGAIHTIDRLQDMLANGYRALRKPRPEVSPELAAAKDEIADLRKRLRVEDELSSLDEQFKTGQFIVREKPVPKKLSPELERALIDLEHRRREVENRKEALRPMTAGRLLAEAVNTARTLKATMDMSATLRQAVVLAARHPIKFLAYNAKAVKAFFSAHSADVVEQSLRNWDGYYLSQKAGLQLTEVGAAPGLREEHFLSRTLERIPVLKEVVHASNRHMTTLLNLVRVGAFESFLKANPNATTVELTAYADFINAATGRGSLGPAAGYAGELGLLFFAPRFAVSRFQTPWKMVKYWQMPRVRKAIAQDLIAAVGAGMTTLALAKLAGFGVGYDPRNADFGKITFGNRHYDIWGGFQQPARFFVRALTWVSDQKGWTGKDLSEADKMFAPWEAFSRLVEYKVSPGVSMPIELVSGKTIFGEPRTWPETLGRALMPIFAENVMDAWRAEGWQGIAATAPESFFGANVQIYDPWKRQAPHTPESEAFYDLLDSLRKQGKTAEAYAVKTGQPSPQGLTAGEGLWLRGAESAVSLIGGYRNDYQFITETVKEGAPVDDAWAQFQRHEHGQPKIDENTFRSWYDRAQKGQDFGEIEKRIYEDMYPLVKQLQGARPK